MKYPRITSFLYLTLISPLPAQTPVEILPPPPQDQALPYTRSAEAAGLAKIADGITVFPGSRYGYVNGLRVRLDSEDLLRAEAVGRGDDVFVPPAFAALVGLKEIHAKPVPKDLALIADRWVYAPDELAAGAAFKPGTAIGTLMVKDRTWFSLTDLAKANGLKITRHPRGIFHVGAKPLEFAAGEGKILDDVITLFDTPDKLADPDIATRSIPALTRQGKWTDHVKVTPQQLANLNGPETQWPTAPHSEDDLKGFNAKLLGSKPPPPGVYPRLLFSPEDVPMLAQRVKSTRIGQQSLIIMEHLFKTTWLDPATDDGKVFKKLATGDVAGLEWDIKPGAAPNEVPQQFKGMKPGIYNSHVAYVPECLTSLALYCLLTGNDAVGKDVAAAVANYYRLREPLVDEWLSISDSEFGSSTTAKDGTVVNLNGAGARTHWRNIHGLVAHMNLAMALDLSGKWMDADDKDTMRRIIAKATYGRRSYAQDAPLRFRDVNWMGWDLPHYLAVAAIEGLPGFDPEAYASGAESVRAYLDWGMDDSGVVFESNGKTPGSLQFHFLSMITLARRGDNLFGHPHWRKLLQGQIQMTSPSGQVTVNSGTQYVPYSRQALSLNYLNEIKAFFPGSRQPDYLLSKALQTPGAESDDSLRCWPRAGFNPEAFRKEIASWKRVRLPSLTYPGFVNGVLYDADIVSTTRADLGLPLDFSAPTHGVFSAYSDRTPEATWINMMVRPNHYLGAGHHHADAGMFHFSALGVDWFTQTSMTQEYHGKFFNLVQVDGKSEPEPIPGFPNTGILGYNGAATYLGASNTPQFSAAAADLTYAYSWRWMTQPPQVFTPKISSLAWEMDPSPAIQKIFAGTARYKMRPWWTNYTFENFIPTSRAPFNPMERVYRNVGLIRGGHPYGLVIDDLKKDDAQHLYQWAAMPGGGVWKASVPGLAANQIALAWRPGLEKKEIAPQAGEPLLIVTALGMDDSGDAKLPLFQVETADGPGDRGGKPQQYERLVINRRAKEVGFKVLLLPVRAGAPLPVVKYDAGKNSATVSWPDQKDTLRFSRGSDSRTRVSASRGGKALNP